MENCPGELDSGWILSKPDILESKRANSLLLNSSFKSHSIPIERLATSFPGVQGQYKSDLKLLIQYTVEPLN